LYFHTLRFLTPRQIFYRIYYPIRNSLVVNKNYILSTDSLPVFVHSKIGFPLKNGRWMGENHFKFLNVEHDFDEQIDWNYPAQGKLWSYHLNYFEFLLDEACTEESATRLMNDYINAESSLTIGKSPYPACLRIFSWIKTIVRFNITKPKYLSFVRCDLMLLSRNIEYHVSGNHLLENGLALSFGGMALDDDSFFDRGFSILKLEMDLQILDDGGHYERSPMYQQILIERFLDCLNLDQDKGRSRRFRDFIEPYLIRMISWLKSMTFQNGQVAMVNDATSGMSMSTSELETYAAALGIDANFPMAQMKASGYRRYEAGDYECIVDAGDVGPDHLLAHAHSDTLSFCLNFRGRPLVVDSGTSTYESGDIRQYERSTRAHNTVIVDGLEQSVAWASFRVARRAHARILEEGKGYICATHDGYSRIGTRHVREFHFGESSIRIEDRVEGGKSHVAYLHFAPDLDPDCIDGNQIRVGDICIRLMGSKSLNMESYSFAQGFNRRTDAWCICISFEGHLQMLIEAA